MKSLMISDHAKWCALMMNGIKTKEIRTSKALANAIQKLIDEYGYADIYDYCTKGKDLLVFGDSPFKEEKEYCVAKDNIALNGDKLPILNGKVLFKFRCYKVEEITYDSTYKLFKLNNVLQNSCLKKEELFDYLKGKVGYDIQISDLKIFDKPKDLSEFRKPHTPSYEQTKPFAEMFGEPYTREEYRKQCEIFGFVLTKAPQNFAYVESVD